MDEKEPVEKITLLDVFIDLGLQHEVVLAVGTGEISLQPSSTFACVYDEAKSCIVHYNDLREVTGKSQKANLELEGSNWTENSGLEAGTGYRS